MQIDVTGAFIYFTIPIFGGIPITQTTVSFFIVTVILCTLFITLGKGLKKRPDGKQVLVEKGVMMVQNMVAETMGAHNLHWTPFIGTIFLCSIFGSLIGLTGFFRATTADLAVVLTWAVMTSLIIWYQAIKRKGFWGWLKGFAQPIAVMLPINIVSELAQPIAMAFRHFGNVAGGSIVTMIVYTALSAASQALFEGIRIPVLQLGLPAILSVYFDIFSGFVQAFVFSLLSMVYIAGACPPPEKAK